MDSMSTPNNPKTTIPNPLRDAKTWARYRACRDFTESLYALLLGPAPNQPDPDDDETLRRGNRCFTPRGP